MAAAFRADDQPGFAEAVRSHLDGLASKQGFAADLTKASREQLLSFAAPFYYGMVISVFAGLLAIVSWFSPGRLEWARRSAVWIMLLVLAIHTIGLIARFIIEGRPPVTTLYTSAIFIGWAAAIFGLLLERIYPFAIGIVVAAALEFCSLFIAHYLHIQDGTTFKVLQPVLNTNFWLATHVVAVTLGYAATFVGGFIAIAYIIRAAFARNLTPDLAKALTRMVYAVICFATLFSFVGTVLGGLWADQSWGRFWGWDVKENGALMIVLWNAILLHARWGGIVKERGLMCLAVGGNIVTAWSWFGVNNLGIGLHSYGFTSGVMIALVIFAAVQLAIILCAWAFCAPSIAAPKAKPELEPQAA
jgi:ABC-type transport system involved in cytochrome c biogenesis permease subunit